jgi:hypothetical protein
MTLPIRAFLIIRAGADDWRVNVCRDLDAVQESWSARAEERQSAVLHIGFDRPASAAFEELLAENAGRMLLTASAVHGLPSAFRASSHPIGFVGALPVHLALTGWGYSLEEELQAPERSPDYFESDGWISDYLAERPDDAAHLFEAGITDEQTYCINEQRLSPEVRYRAGLFRFNTLVAGADVDPCEIARAAPPSLQQRELESLGLTVRLENVFSRAEIVTVIDLAKHTLAGLYRLPNFGRKSERDLRQILLQAINTGPPIGMPERVRPSQSDEASDVGATFPETATMGEEAPDELEGFTLLNHIRRTVAARDPRAGDVLCRRMGLGRPSETLQEIADTYGLTRERIRQIEANNVRRIVRVERWDDLLTNKIRTLLTNRTYPLPVLGLEAVDEWFCGVSAEVEAFRYALSNFCEGGVSTVQIGAVEYIGFVSPGKWQSLLGEAQRVLSYASEMGSTESELRRLLAAILPDDAREFTGLLWETATRHCYFSTNDEGERVLVAHGRGADHAVQAILLDAEKPLHYTEIADWLSERLKKPVDVRRAHNAAAAVGILMGRGVFGAEKHLGLTPDQITNIAEEASSIILNGPDGKQWHAAEVLAVLTERGVTSENLDKYGVDYCLRSAKGLQGLGRMAWRAAAEAVHSSQRLEMRQAIEAVLMEAGKPLSTAELRQRLVALRGVNDIFQFSTVDPIIRIGPGLWGLNDRDVPIPRTEQRDLFNDVVAVLHKRQSGIHVSEIGETLGERWAQAAAHIVMSLCNFDPRLKVSLGQFVHLNEWEGPRRETVLQTVQRLVSEMPSAFTNEDVARRVRERTSLPFETSQISACLRSAGAVYDSINRVWSVPAASEDWDLDEAV